MNKTIMMLPHIDDYKTSKDESGIRRVIEAYCKYLPSFGYDTISRESKNPYDLKAVHAGMTSGDCDIAHLHGMYFTGDYKAPGFEYEANKNIAEACRNAKAITVPSFWVAEILRRDMHYNPHVIYHGINTNEWIHNYKPEEYVLWNKNRNLDVCSTDHVNTLAKYFPKIRFKVTVLPDNPCLNVDKIGIIRHEEMKKYVQKASVYLSTTKETFGIGILEAMASGTPVLGFDYGGNSFLVKHKVNGYLAEPNNYEDLAIGLQYCLANRSSLGSNGIEIAKMWTWEAAIENLAKFYDSVIENKENNKVSIVIPCHNYADKVGRAIESCINQTYKDIEIIVVFDDSTDDIKSVKEKYTNVSYYEVGYKNVSDTRNYGIQKSISSFICCLDADDRIEPTFIEKCIDALKKDETLTLAYTGLKWIKPDGSEGISNWPDVYNYDRQISRHNQVPTCCVFRRKLFDRTGGYRNKYCQDGAGSEDAALWTMAGALGLKAKKITEEPLFVYSWMSGSTSKKGYREADWLELFPYSKDQQHPFASLATPIKMSHKVRQYDEPIISVIIPVGKGHEHKFHDAVDSIEGQTFRKWECIVVWDSQESIPSREYNSMPFVNFCSTHGNFAEDTFPKGAGFARNLGAKNAQGRLLVFLDADDTLEPKALELMFKQYLMCESIVYTDYYGLSIMDEQAANGFGSRLVSWSNKTHRTILKHDSLNYDCLRAQRQPDKERKDIYHWCLVTCLIPKRKHFEINGFDEKMRSWEDVDYHWRMAKTGFPYTRIQIPLMTYNFIGGTRRELANPDNDGGQNARNLIEYMLNKYKDTKNMACKTCGGGKVVDVSTSKAYSSQEKKLMEDENFVMARYLSLNIGDHKVTGNNTGIEYGYRCGGDTFLVHRADVKGSPHLFEKVDDIVSAPIAETIIEVPIEKEEKFIDVFEENMEDMSIPVLSDKNTIPVNSKDNLFNVVETATTEELLLDEVFSLENIPMLTRESKDAMTRDGLVTKEAILAAGVEGLMQYSYIGRKKAEKIINWIKDAG